MSSSTTPLKSVLCVGINPSKRDTEESRSAGPSPEIIAMTNKQVSDAKSLGYDLHMKFIAPDEMEVGVPRVTEILREREWNGMIVGGGIRKEFGLTVYFEKLVNAGRRELRKEAKMGFNTSPVDIVGTIERMFRE